MESPEALVERLVGETRNLPRGQRAAYLDKTCGALPEVRQKVESLLDVADRSGHISQADGAPIPDLQKTGFPGSPSGSLARLGRYVILEQLGAGGMGVVYRARDERLERIVAIKVLNAGLLTSEAARSHFRREALALARVNHSNIATAYDVGEQDGIDYIVMEWVQGRSLRDRMLEGPLEPEEAIRIAQQIAEALQEAHGQGVIHRDLKPANVMITPRGQVKVLDFGLAKLLADTDVTQSLLNGPVGTPHYMSPEQALGKTVDVRTDLWSLGVVFYETLTGRLPFGGDSAVSVLRAIVSDQFKPVRKLRPDIPVGAERIVDKALEKNQYQRYATAEEIGRDASALLQRMSAPVKEQASGHFLRILSAALILVLLAGAAAGWWLYRRASERRWAREEAIPQIDSLIEAHRPLAAFQVLEKAEKDLPGDAHLKRIQDENSQLVDLTSDPPGAEVTIQDYGTPNGPPLELGATPLNRVRIPKGYFRWTVSRAGFGKVVAAPETKGSMDFSLSRTRSAPTGMVYGAGGAWESYVAFLGWIGPYKFPPYYVDQFEVTNREFQKFVDSGGYGKPQYWPKEFPANGRTLQWSEAMQMFHDTTGRPGPSTWVEDTIKATRKILWRA